MEHQSTAGHHGNTHSRTHSNLGGSILVDSFSYIFLFNPIFYSSICLIPKLGIEWVQYCVNNIVYILIVFSHWLISTAVWKCRKSFEGGWVVPGQTRAELWGAMCSRPGGKEGCTAKSNEWETEWWVTLHSILNTVNTNNTNAFTLNDD